MSPSTAEGYSAEWALRSLQGSPVFVRELVAGGIAGGIAKSSVAPLERTKILFQTGRIKPGHGVWHTLTDIAKNEGWRGMFKGNTATVTRIIPYSAIHFWAYEHCRRVFFSEAEARQLRTGPWLDLLAGSAAGSMAVAITYPLDLVRTRMAWQLEEAQPTPPAAKGAAPSKAAAGLANPASGRKNAGPSGAAGLHGSAQLRQAALSSGPATPAGPYRITMARTALGVVRNEGIAGLYKGVMPTLWGILPYAGIKFYVYQSLKQRYRHRAVKSMPEEGASATPQRLPVPLMLAFGAASGLLGQTLTYPLDIVRRRMQVQGAGSPGGGPVVPPGQPVYRTTLGCLLGMWRNEGLGSLFYGLHINYIKVVPSTALGFMIYDYMKSVLLLPNHL